MTEYTKKSLSNTEDIREILMHVQELLYENNKDNFSKRTKQKYPLLKNKCEAKFEIKQLKHY